MVNTQGDRRRNDSSLLLSPPHSPSTRIGDALPLNRTPAIQAASAPSKSSPEDLLVSAARVGCTRSFETLYSLYSQRVFRTIVSITFNREDAEDALQQTFLRAYLAIGQFEGRSTFYSWITRIAINSSLMILRHRRNQPQIACSNSSETEEHTWIDNIQDPAPNPEQAYERAEQSRTLQSALQKLRPNERVVLERHLLDDPSIHDLADSLDISRLAAKSRLYRARAHLVARMKGQPYAGSRSSPMKPSHEPSAISS